MDVDPGNWFQHDIALNLDDVGSQCLYQSCSTGLRIQDRRQDNKMPIVI